MEVVKRHGMAMGSSSASTTMTMAGMAASTTMAAMASGTSTGMSAMDHGSGGMDHGMDMVGMNMYFTTKYNNYPVMFKSLSADSKAKAFGIFVLLFALGFFLRGCEFYRNYLEQRVWKNPAYVGSCPPVSRALSNKAALQEKAASANSGGCCTTTANESSSINKLSHDIDDTISAGTGSETETQQQQQQQLPPRQLSLASSLFRDAIRLILCIIPDLFGYALMLAAMSFCLVYFFGVVLGLGVGRFVFEKLSDRTKLRAVTSGMNSHC
ncbi:copper transport protein Ctr1p [[Candida] anglica]|uniref:Copper transport protein n=1 Tax=[Candida] anglica TaxID=148631 RepID=A0ABP0EJX5_9ASCO